jgi:polyhydroxyalkanoate synthesis repressor PhaR
VTPDKPAGRPRPIRRYGNRKLYDPATRRYVTLEDLARMVAGGQEIEVVEQKSGDDLTSLTLAQVLLEGLKQGASRIPRQVLTRLIRIAAGPASAWGDWPEPQDTASRARQETERIVSRVLGRGRLSLDDAVALRQDVGQMVHRLVSEAQTGVESRLRGPGSAGRASPAAPLDALRGGSRPSRRTSKPPPPAPAASGGKRRRGRKPNKPKR